MMSNAFTIITTTTPSRHTTTTALFEEVQGAENEENPCWQDLYDDDCSMTSVYAASFVASKWIKGMPCAAGIEVRNVNVFAVR